MKMMLQNHLRFLKTPCTHATHWEPFVFFTSPSRCAEEILVLPSSVQQNLFCCGFMVSKQSQTQSPFPNKAAQVEQDYGNQNNENCVARIKFLI